MLRVGPWPGDGAAVALLAPVGPEPPTAAMVSSALENVRAAGYRRVLTTATAAAERPGFLAAGFAPIAWLHLLARRLDAVPRATPDHRIRRPHRSDWPTIVEVDRNAFSPLWHLNLDGITVARRATASNRVRVATDENGRVVGYAVCGRTGDRGYVQRLAVEPGAQGGGLGSALLSDGLRWMQTRGAEWAFINTQFENDGALRLYLRTGFELQAERLAVLGLDLNR
jgi:ribosomal protein S18 acetylase RimI-like enzyme